jgi:periplasmic divalent cation tolerance protein
VDDYRYCQVVITAGSREEADALARVAVRERLAACAQVIGPVTSWFWWQSELDRAEEWQVVFKTTTARYQALERHLLQAHSYDVPEILCLPVSAGNPAYLEWLDSETAAG